MAVRGDGGAFKYAFHLQPGSSVDDVRLGYRGAEGLKVGAGGELLMLRSSKVVHISLCRTAEREGENRAEATPCSRTQR
jgi:hypothetical protein